MRLNGLAPVAFAIAAVLASMPAFADSGPEGCLKAYVSIMPQAYLVERIGGDLVEVGILAGKGQDPHTYEPAPAQMSALARSDVYFTIGVPFEKALIPKITRLFPSLKIVDTTRGITFRYFDHEDEGHGHGHGGQAPDPHTWLDPGRAGIMAGNIAAALKELDPQHADVFEANLHAFREDLEGLDVRIGRILEPMRGGKIYVFHPAFGYFCEAYGIEQQAFETGEGSRGRGNSPGSSRARGGKG